MGLPDNSLYDNAPVLSYSQICVCGIVSLAVILILSGMVYYVFIVERRELNRSVEYVLQKIADKSGAMLTSDEYADKIDEFIERFI